MVFLVKNRKSEHYYWILHIQISLGNKFQHKMEIWIIWTKFAPKGWKTEKVNITIELCILELFTIPNFIWNWQFFGPNLPNGYAVYMFVYTKPYMLHSLVLRNKRTSIVVILKILTFYRKHTVAWPKIRKLWVNPSKCEQGKKGSSRRRFSNNSFYNIFPTD